MNTCDRHDGAVVVHKSFDCPLCAVAKELSDAREEHQREMNDMIDANHDLQARIDCLQDELANLK